MSYPLGLDDVGAVQALFLVGSGLVILAPLVYGTVTLIILKGFKRGIWRNPLVYATVCLVALGASLAVLRDHQNRPDLSVIGTVASEINASNAVDPAENGATLYEKAIATFSDAPMPNELYRTGVWKRKDHADWATWIGRNKRAFDLAIEGSRRKSIYFVIIPDEDEILAESQLTTVNNWGQRSISGLMDLSRGLCALALSQAGEGDLAGALASLHAVFRAGTSMRRRTLGTLSLGYPLRHMALDALHKVAQAPGLSDRDLEAMHVRLQEWIDTEFVTREHWEARSQLAVLVDTETTLASLRMSSPGIYASSLLITREALRRETRAVWDEMLQPHTPRGMYYALENRGRGAFARSFAGLPERPKDPLRRVVESMHVIDFKYSLESILCQQARTGILSAYLAAARHWKQKAHLPDKWQDLVPKYLPRIPLDPFTNEPLKLTIMDGAVLVYSVGPDGKDNDGACDDFLTAGRYQGKDISLRFPPTPKETEKPDEGD